MVSGKKGGELDVVDALIPLNDDGCLHKHNPAQLNVHFQLPHHAYNQFKYALDPFLMNLSQLNLQLFVYFF